MKLHGETEVTLKIDASVRPASSAADSPPEKVAVETQICATTESSEGYADMARAQHGPVGFCIYCGARESLSREHIIPFGLDGKTVLPAASCRQCAKITGDFERVVLQGRLMRNVRKVLELQSRSKHEAVPDEVELELVKSGTTVSVKVPLCEAPLPLYFPIFDAPRCLAGGDASGIVTRGLAGAMFGPSPTEFLLRHGAQSMTVTFNPEEPAAFAKMIAKIAYCHAFSLGYVGKIEGAAVLPAILGQSDDIGHWVGTFSDPFRTFPGVLHRLVMHENFGDRQLLLCEVQLFANSSTPSYGVVLGRLNGP